MSVNIHGKEYKTVAERLTEFHKDHPKGSIQTEMVSYTLGRVIMKATIRYDEAVPTCSFIGHASEKEDSTMINKTSALENAETSAVGRALAFAGYAGSEIASADEVAQAIHGQSTPKQATPHIDAAKSTYRCVKCLNEIPKVVYDYSMKKLGEPLCRNHQPKKA